MSDGYNPYGYASKPALEDEFLCEYVDGTMDPVVREAFEEYILANPDLAEHVAHLRLTRQLLCRCGRLRKAPTGLQIRIRRRLTYEMMRTQSPRFPSLLQRLRVYATLTSAMIVMMVVSVIAVTVYYKGLQRQNDYQQVQMNPPVSSFTAFYDRSELPPIFIPKAFQMSSALRPRFSSISSSTSVRSSVMSSGQSGTIREVDPFRYIPSRRRSGIAP